MTKTLSRTKRNLPYAKVISSSKEKIFVQTLNVSSILIKANRREQELFQKLIQAIKMGDKTLSQMLANEINQLRILQKKLFPILAVLRNFPNNQNESKVYRR